MAKCICICGRICSCISSCSWCCICICIFVAVSVSVSLSSSQKVHGGDRRCSVLGECAVSVNVTVNDAQLPPSLSSRTSPLYTWSYGAAASQAAPLGDAFVSIKLLNAKRRCRRQRRQSRQTSKAHVASMRYSSYSRLSRKPLPATLICCSNAGHCSLSKQLVRALGNRNKIIIYRQNLAKTKDILLKLSRPVSYL